MQKETKLWLLKPQKGLPNNDNPWKPWADKVFGFVIRAHSAIEARTIAHNAGHQKGEDEN